MEAIWMALHVHPNDRPPDSFAYHVAQLALTEHPDTLDWLRDTKFPRKLIERLEARR